MKEYPYFRTSNEKDMEKLLLAITKERRSDIRAFDNLVNVFIRGRKVDKIPSGASDVAADDRLGDFNYSASYLYLCVDNSGTVEWRRAALSSW